MMQKQAVKANSEYILPLKINYILINLNNVYNINGSGTVKVKEMISNIEYNRNADTMKNPGLTVCLNGYQAQIFKYNY